MAACDASVRVRRRRGVAGVVAAMVLVSGLGVASAGPAVDVEPAVVTVDARHEAVSVAGDPVTGIAGDEPSVVADDEAPEVDDIVAGLLDAVRRLIPGGGGDLPRRPPVAEGDVFASPDGSPAGDGSPDSPYDLATALAAQTVGPGATVWLRGGTYHGTFTSRLEGEPDDPIVVRSYPGEWAVLDAGTVRETGLTIRGSDTWFRDLEVMRSDPSRSTSMPGPGPADMSRAHAAGIDVFGPRTKVINFVVRDSGNGVGFWEPAEDAELYGGVIFNNGWQGPDNPWGHGVYVQNRDGTKRIRDVVILNNYRFGVHGYGEDGYVSGVHMEGVVSFENGSLSNAARQPNIFVGTLRRPMRDIVVRDSIMYHRPGQPGSNLRLGGRPQDDSVSVAGNFVSGGTRAVAIQRWLSASFTGNLVHLPDGIDMPYAAEVVAPAAVSAYEWNSNAYSYHPDVEPRFSLNGTDLDYAAWRAATGFDAHSEFSAGTPGGVDVTVRPNAYEPGRGNVVVVNWANHDRVRVDLSSLGVRIGSRIEVRDAEAFLGQPVFSGVYRGPVWLTMTTTEVTPPVGDGPVPEHTPRGFGAFVVLPGQV